MLLPFQPFLPYLPFLPFLLPYPSLDYVDLLTSSIQITFLAYD
jgi:hypothetical protein